MALTIKHTFVSNKSDGTDPTLIRPSNWNDDHTIEGTIDEAALTLTDVTTANASTSKHGFLKKLPGGTDLFLNGAGNFTTVDETGITLADNTTNNVSIVKHGLAPKLPNDAAMFLSGVGTWLVPAGGGGGESLWVESEGLKVYLSTEGYYKVGINWGDPENNFVVYGPSYYGTMELLAAGDNNEASIAFRSANIDRGDVGHWWMGVNTNESSAGRFGLIAAGHGEVLTINTTGHVGIGVTPDYNLDVSGDVNFTGNMYHDGVQVNFVEGDATGSMDGLADFKISVSENNKTLTIAGGRANSGRYTSIIEGGSVTLIELPIINIEWGDGAAVFTVESTEHLMDNQPLSISGATGVGMDVFNGFFEHIAVTNETQFMVSGIDHSDAVSYTTNSATAGKGSASIEPLIVIADTDDNELILYANEHRYGGAIYQITGNISFGGNDAEELEDWTLSGNGVYVGEVYLDTNNDEFVFDGFEQHAPSVQNAPRFSSGSGVNVRRDRNRLYFDLSNPANWLLINSEVPNDGMYTGNDIAIGTNTSGGYRLNVDGDVNFTGTLHHNGTPFAAGNQFAISIGGSEGSSPVLTVGEGRATIASGSGTFDTATFTFQTIQLVSVSATNPAVLTLGQEPTGMRYDQRIAISGATGANTGWLNGIPSGRVINIDGNNVTLDMDGSDIVYDENSAVVGRGGSQSTYGTIVADLDDGSIALVVGDDFPFLVVTENGYVRRDAQGDISIEGWGVPLGLITAYSGDENDAVTWSEPEAWFPAVTAAPNISGGYGVQVQYAYGQAIIHATGRGFVNMTVDYEINDNFWWDGENSRLGLGITDPGYRLDVTGDINYTGDLRHNGTALTFGDALVDGSNVWTGNNNFLLTVDGTGDNTGLFIRPTVTGPSDEVVALAVTSQVAGETTNIYTVRLLSPDLSGDGTSSHNIYGIHINDHTHNSITSFNLYSAGATSTNFFEGKVCIAPDSDINDPKFFVGQVMDGDVTALPMISFGMTAGDNRTTSIGLYLHTHTNGNTDGSITGVYVQNHNTVGEHDAIIGIHIATPNDGAESIVTQTGLRIDNQDNGNVSDAFNIYSAGDESNNLFEGKITIGSPTRTALSDLTQWFTSDGSVASVNTNGTIRSHTTASTIVSLTSVDNVATVDARDGNIQIINLTMNCWTTANNLIQGQRLTLIFRQDDDGGWSGIFDTDVFIGAKPIGLAPNEQTVQEFVCLDGQRLIASDLLNVPRAFLGNPNPTLAGASLQDEPEDPNSTINMQAITAGPGSNGMTITFDTNSIYVQTLVYQWDGNNALVCLRNSAGISEAPASEVITALNTGMISGIVTASCPGSGAGIVQPGAVVLSGGLPAKYVATGGELSYDGDAGIWVGQSNGSFKLVEYAT